MKSKIKKVSSITVSLVVLVVITTALAEPAADPVSGSGSSSALPNGYQFAGSATLIIRGQEKSAELLVTVLAEIEVSDEGVQHVVASHTFTFADGSITTSDKEIAEPADIPGLYNLNANMEVISGTGVYEGVSGHLTAHGTIDFRSLPTAEFELAGSISTVEGGQ